MTTAIGRPLDRVDGPAKVTGAGRYSADVPLPGLVHAVVVGSRIPAGRIVSIDTHAAEQAEGVLAVLTHLNLPKGGAVPPLMPSLAGAAATGQTFFPMQDEVIHYAGQHVAVLVAETLEQAEHAATLLRIDYAAAPFVTTVEQGREQAYEAQRIFGGFLPGRIERGDVAAGLAQAAVTVDLGYRYAANHHNPIECSATTAVWEGDRLTVYDATQGPNATLHTLAELLNIMPSHIRVVTNFVGGSFGCKAMIWDHPALAALAARHVGRPVRLALSREQMFSSVGHREEQEQQLTIGADEQGRLRAIRHHKLSPTSHFDDWAEPSLGVASQLYACPNYEGVYRLIRANTMTPTFTRCPGEASGMFALETALDELADKLGLDPLEIRLRNYAETTPGDGTPWSSKKLRECYQRGAELAGWDSRDPRPGTLRDGNTMLGWGMATSAYPCYQPGNPQRARARLFADGSAVVQASISDIGTGSATAMTQVAADGLGVPLERVRFQYGDSDLPNTAAAVGSAGAGMVSAAVHVATTALRDQLIAQAIADPGSPLHDADPKQVAVAEGRMALRERPDVGETYAALLQRAFMADAEAVGTWNPPPDTSGGSMTFGAQFAQVAVDPDLGLVRVRKLIGVFDPGRVLNRKTAHSQLMGGMIWGMSHALLEGSRMGPDGRWANASLGEYLVPVNADAPAVVVETIESTDTVVNPLGVKGVGEVGMVGTAAAIANAIHHATGRRLHKLPITIEDLL
ncbi:xanthine dehydrogenase family protein molybdopterin-binding subunit [Catellatospora tritici]|uniref:xanthine dehydrogenase family protein molybdopterin-binding subunit n=1 Tax=Catellatospora tritici TaxID=2851566 RepID=UPI001C2DAD91|nr:xanthine dehydrogenase family protein molybdopterin-binding subunit [Catellatospora tritici]MBV1851281.1 xanthine dehydrogenase family protein molybdopterin-binding subunit [Catellatospora tritici]